MKYTLEQFKEYLSKQDSLGDTIYNLKNFESFLVRKTHYIVGEDNLNDFFVELEDHPFADYVDGGFDWQNTDEGEDFWESVIVYRNFDLFFEKYPKENSLKMYSLEEMKNQLIGEQNSEKRNEYEQDLQDDIEKEKSKPRFQYFEEGQKVYWYEFPNIEGEVTSISYSENHSLVECKFNDTYYLFTFDGRVKDNTPIVLSQKPIEPIVNIPILPFETEELVAVRNSSEFEWELGYYLNYLPNIDKFVIRKPNTKKQLLFSQIAKITIDEFNT